MLNRLRRNRKNAQLRNLVQETSLDSTDFIAPVFVVEGNQVRSPISSMPGHYRFSKDLLIYEIEELVKLGVRSFAIFPVIDPSKKSLDAREAYNPSGLIPSAVSFLKKEFPDILIITDIALDPYTIHGHDGIVNEFHEIENDQTVEILTKQALCHAFAGVDIVAPSDMMDGRILSIRKALEKEGFFNTNILSYTAKYASSLYYPFRDALQTSLSFGDKKSYQMNTANKREATLEALIDFEEGADLLMVKPASLYLDIISKIREEVLIPVGAYHVSGEYAMVMAADEKGYLKAPEVFYETLLSIKRSGASFMFTYASKIVLENFNLLREKSSLSLVSSKYDWN